MVGTFIFTFGGWRGYLMLIGFFIVGSVTTKIGYAGKAAAGIAQAAVANKAAARNHTLYIPSLCFNIGLPVGQG